MMLTFVEIFFLKNTKSGMLTVLFITSKRQQGSACAEFDENFKKFLDLKKFFKINYYLTKL